MDQDSSTTQPGSTPPSPAQDDMGQGGIGQGGPASPSQGGWQPPASPEPASPQGGPALPSVPADDTHVGGGMGSDTEEGRGGSDTSSGAPFRDVA